MTANKFIKTDRQDFGGDFHSNGFDENRRNLIFIVTILPAAYKGVRNKEKIMEASTIPIINSESDRKKSIIENTPAIFEIDDNPSAVSSEPLIELDSQSEVAKWCSLIIQSALKHKVDSRLAMAIMYMETTHGWYDRLYPDFL